MNDTQRALQAETLVKYIIVFQSDQYRVYVDVFYLAHVAEVNFSAFLFCRYYIAVCQRRAKTYQKRRDKRRYDTQDRLRGRSGQTGRRPSGNYRRQNKTFDNYGYAYRQRYRNAYQVKEDLCYSRRRSICVDIVYLAVFAACNSRNHGYIIVFQSDQYRVYVDEI